MPPRKYLSPTDGGLSPRTLAAVRCYPSETVKVRLPKRVLDRASLYAEGAGLTLAEWCTQMIECCVADRRMRDRQGRDAARYEDRNGGDYDGA